MTNHTVPMPRPISLLLAVTTIGFNALAGLTHSELNAWIATIVGIMSFIHYSRTFYLVWKEKKKVHHKKHYKNKI